MATSGDGATFFSDESDQENVPEKRRFKFTREANKSVRKLFFRSKNVISKPKSKKKMCENKIKSVLSPNKQSAANQLKNGHIETSGTRDIGTQTDQQLSLLTIGIPESQNKMYENKCINPKCTLHGSESSPELTGSTMIKLLLKPFTVKLLSPDTSSICVRKIVYKQRERNGLNASKSVEIPVVEKTKADHDEDSEHYHHNETKESSDSHRKVVYTIREKNASRFTKSAVLHLAEEMVADDTKESSKIRTKRK